MSKTYLHSSSYIDEGAQIGSGTKVWHYCHIMPGAHIGEDCNIGQNVFIASNTRIGNRVKIQNNVSVYTGVVLEDDVFLGPSMVFTNVTNPRSHVDRRGEYQTTLVKRGATIGANATILCGVSLGEYVFIGAGAVVTRNIPAYALAYGTPAKVQGWVCQCGYKLDFKKRGDFETAACQTCGAHYQKSGYIVTPVVE